MTTATATLQRDASHHQLTNLGEKQAAVLAVIAERGPVSDRQIAALLEWPINRVNPRRNELVERGLVMEAGVTFDAETGRNVTLWYVISHEQKQQRDMGGRTFSSCPANLVILSGNGPLTPSNDPTPANDTKTALEASQALSGDLPLKREIPLGQRLWFADRAAREAGLENYWVELYRLVAIATNARELAYAFEIIAGYKANAVKAGTEEYVRKEYLIIKDLATWKQKELKNEMR